MGMWKASIAAASVLALSPALAQEGALLTVEQIAFCAEARAEIDASEIALTQLRADVDRVQAEFERMQQRYGREHNPPARYRRKEKDYNRLAEDYSAAAEAHNARIPAFEQACSGGRAGWEPYREACRPYVGVGNSYCEGFGAYWDRLAGG